MPLEDVWTLSLLATVAGLAVVVYAKLLLASPNTLGCFREDGPDGRFFYCIDCHDTFDEPTPASDHAEGGGHRVHQI